MHYCIEDNDNAVTGASKGAAAEAALLPGVAQGLLRGTIELSARGRAGPCGFGGRPACELGTAHAQEHPGAPGRELGAKRA